MLEIKKMTHTELKEYNLAQIAEMEKHKWIMSEKHGSDLRDQAIMDWIRKYSKSFREEWLAKKGK